MVSYIIKRVILSLVTIFLVSTITFFLMYLVPGGPFLAEKSPSAATLAALNEKYGLDQPVIVQYKNYMLKAIKGDFGPSMKVRGKDVEEIMSSKFPVSARLGLIAVGVSLLLGIPLGSVSALKRNTLVDKIILFISTCGIAVPSFISVTALMYFFGVVLGWLPTFGITTPAHYVLPVISLAFYPTAYISRMMRASMLDVLGQDYMRTARAKGLNGFTVLFKHALRNAILPIITYLGPMLSYILVGSFAVEKILTIPGLGGQYVSSISNRDYSMIMGTTIFLAIIMVVMNLLVDIAYKIVDPRIKFE